MKRGVIYLLMGVLCACSTQKNTAPHRAYHQLTTHYNVYFNGREAYREGLLKINDANVDNYNTILPLYPISNHTNLQVATSEMDLSISKCRKCIKLHSITVKPKPNPHKQTDSKYQQWLKREEFNNQMGRAWIMLGASEFHKGDFLECIGTFKYVIKHYSWDKDMVAQCQLWIVRAYCELGWMYDTEELLEKIQSDALKPVNSTLYAAVCAEVCLREKRYEQAIPLIHIAIKGEKRKMYKPRFYYILGQLYQRQGDIHSAEENYHKVLKKHPMDVQLSFNAKLQRAVLNTNTSKSIRTLKRMTRNEKYNEQLEQIYGTLADLYLTKRDTLTAITYYQIAIDSARTNSISKGNILLKLADIYYNYNSFLKAYPLYQQALNIFPHTDEIYVPTEKRTAFLDELVPPWTQWTLQDSLQRLAKYPLEKQQTIITSLIEEERIKDLKAQVVVADEPQVIETPGRRVVGGLPTLNRTRNISVGQQEWYFYNKDLLKMGQTLFVQKWGNRPLQDDWRRGTNQLIIPSLEEDNEEEVQEEVVNEDTTSVDSVYNEKYDPVYYLKQIPHTEKEFTLSDTMWCQGLSKSILVLLNEGEHPDLCAELISMMERKFPKTDALAEVYYYDFLSAKRNKDNVKAHTIQQRLVEGFPKHPYTLLLLQAEQIDASVIYDAESLYERTYAEYKKGNYSIVLENCLFAEEHYSTNTIVMPYFLFLKAVALAKTQGQQAFSEALNTLVTQYPTDPLGARGKDMLAMMQQGYHSEMGKEGLPPDALTQARQEVLVTSEGQAQDEGEAFSDITNEMSYVIIFTKNLSDSSLNQLLFDVALFNFTQFMVKDYDLTILPLYAGHQAIRISVFENYTEAQWYKNLLLTNSDLKKRLQELKTQVISITESNSHKLTSPQRLQDYIRWLNGE